MISVTVMCVFLTLANIFRSEGGKFDEEEEEVLLLTYVYPFGCFFLT